MRWCLGSRISAILVLFVSQHAARAEPEASLRGLVQNENSSPVAGARVVLRPREGGEVRPTVTGVRGEFVFPSLAPGIYLLDVEREGYYSIRNEVIQVTSGDHHTEFTLIRVREDYERIDVTAPPPAVDMDITAAPESLSGAEILNVPVPTTNDLRSSLRIIPGVVRDNRGGLHLSGGAEDQVMYTLNGFNITDPLTGRFDSRVSVEAVQSVDVLSGNLGAEFGKGSAGTMAISTRSGDDQFRYSGTNFIPGVETRKGIYLGNWTPRFNFSGPILRQRAWFYNSADVQYIKSVVEDLPRGDDRTSSWRFSNMASTQVNVTPSQIVHAGFLVNAFTAPRTGLSVLDPWESTIDRRSRQYFFYAKDQIYLPRRALIEAGVALNRTFNREIPQGHELQIFTPYGKRGNHFVDAVRKSAREQFLVTGFLPSFEFLGGHLIKAGMDLNRLHYWQDVRRTGFENFNEEGVRLRRTVFMGSGLLQRSNYETAWFIQDAWRARPSLLLELGLRGDWDHILKRWDVAPRIGFAWSPPLVESTKFYAGFARIYDATNLRIFTRPLDQYAVTTYFTPSGGIARGPAVSAFTISDPRLRRPRYHNWTAGLERQWSAAFSTRLEYLHRRGAEGFSFVNSLGSAPPPPVSLLSRFPAAAAIDSIFDLTNQRTDSFDSLSLSMRHHFRNEYEWMFSYTWSRALSNTVVDINVEDPLMISNEPGRMPWDAPHRVLSWGYLPTLWKTWAVAYLLETRSGFPFNVQGEDGRLIEGPSSRRFPTYFELNLHLEKKFVFRKYRWAFRFGANNLTNRRNPDTVNAVFGSSRFLQFFGGAGRSVNFRIRWLGRL